MPAKAAQAATNGLAAAFEDMKRHLADDAGLDLPGTVYRLGRTLRFDPQAEEFIGDAEANQMLNRSYRGPFVVPGRECRNRRQPE